MISETFHLEFITPSFCAGANQAKAEIRASSIRGQLRWWFRALSGSRAEESALFGAIAGDSCKSSPLIVRVSEVKKNGPWNPPPPNPNATISYIYHFASVSAEGKRWTQEGNISPRTTFKLSLVWRRTVALDLLSKFELARNCFLLFGGIGLRITRGLGAFQCKELSPTPENLTKFTGLMEKSGFVLRLAEQRYPDFEKALSAAGAWLKNDLRKECKAKTASPLGSSAPLQTSAVHLRPIKLSDSQYGLLFFEAPHQRVLGEHSRKMSPMLKNREFRGVPPAGEIGRRKY